MQSLSFSFLWAITTRGTTIDLSLGLAAAYEIGSRWNKKEINDLNYATIVTFLAENLNSTSISTEEEEARQIAANNLMNDYDVYNYEQAIILLSGGTPEAFNFRGPVFEKCQEESLQLVEKRILMITEVHKIRDMTANATFIGIVGPENSGKTTFINKMWNFNLPCGIKTHTKKPSLEKITSTVHIIDYPGSNSLDTHYKTFSICGPMNNITIIIIATAGLVQLNIPVETKMDNYIYL